MTRAAADASGPILVHGTAIAIAGRAVLIRGSSGAGKSDLALRLLAGEGRLAGDADAAVLVADDQVRVWRQGMAAQVAPPASIAGRIEARGVGILAVPYLAEARLALIVDLCRLGDEPRMPDPDCCSVLLGVAVPSAVLWPFAASAPLRLRQLLAGTERREASELNRPAGSVK